MFGIASLLFRWLHPLKSHRNTAPITIGVCGLSHNAGVTCLCIALSNYLCSKRRESTAYVEMNASRAICNLKPNPNHTDSAFCLSQVIYYPQATMASLPEILHKGYSWVILDFGVTGKYTLPEFLRCDHKLILCDSSPWKRVQTEEQLAVLLHENHLQESITLLENAGTNSCEEAAGFSSCRRIRLPHLSNPFQITSEEFEVFDKILSGVIYHT